MAQAGTTLGLGQSRTTMANKPLGFWPVAIVAALAVAIVLATAFLVATTKIGTVDRSDAQIEMQRSATLLSAPAPILTREQIMAQRDADSAPISAAGGAIERYYSSSAAQHSSVLQKGPASGYSDAEAQRGLHGKLR